MKLVRCEELGASGSAGNYAGALATPSCGAGEVSVIRQRQEPGAVNPLHSHDREEVMVMLSGSVLVTAGDEEVEVSEGDSLIVPSGAKHSIRNDGEGDAEWLLVAPGGVSFVFADGTVASPEWAK